VAVTRNTQIHERTQAQICGGNKESHA